MKADTRTPCHLCIYHEVGMLITGLSEGDLVHIFSAFRLR